MSDLKSKTRNLKLNEWLSMQRRREAISMEGHRPLTMLVVVTDHHIERLDNIAQYRKAEPYPLVLGISDQFQ